MVVIRFAEHGDSKGTRIYGGDRVYIFVTVYLNIDYVVETN